MCLESSGTKKRLDKRSEKDTIPNMSGTAEMIPQAEQYPANPIPERRTDNRPPTGGGRKPWWQDAVTREKYNIFKMLRAEGYSTTKSAEAIGYAPSYGEVIDGKIKEFEARKADSGTSVGFLTEKRINRAAGVVDKLMRGVTFGEIKEIKDSTVLRAAETVLDRSHPKRSESESGPSVSFVTINLGFLASQATDPVSVDITPTAAPPDLGVLGDGI